MPTAHAIINTFSVIVRFATGNHADSSDLGIMFHLMRKLLFHADFIHERNKLLKETFPALRRYCQQVGLEFEIVDMRWGVRDENISYHITSEICIQEIVNCQRVSLGPSLLVSRNSSFCIVGLNMAG